MSPRVREDSVHPRRLLGASGRPLNFTVRRHMTLGTVLGVALGGALAAYLLLTLAIGLKRGALPTRAGYLYRQLQPGDFWFAAAIYVLLAGGYVGIAIWIFMAHFK